jgi:hypothetical protein
MPIPKNPTNTPLDAIIARLHCDDYFESEHGYFSYTGSLHYFDCIEASHHIERIFEKLYPENKLVFIQEWADSVYRHVWLCECKDFLAEITHCEGDVIIYYGINEEMYQKIVLHSHKVYCEEEKENYLATYTCRNGLALPIAADALNDWLKEKEYGSF